MSETDSLASEVIRPIFRPFTRTSLDKIHARMTEETNRKKELERKRVEGEVSIMFSFLHLLFKNRKGNCPIHIQNTTKHVSIFTCM